jgi:5-methylcytosine-specific restriction enzyme A
MPKIATPNAKEALYLNGVYESVLEEILAAQAGDRDRECYLQPYAGATIRLLADRMVSASAPLRLYVSTTELLPMVSYRALVTRWEDKRNLSAARLRTLDRRVREFQPNEERVYPTVNGKECVNLLTVIRLERLLTPLPVSTFLKISNGEPLQPRTRSGGWSPVFECPEWVGSIPSAGVEDAFEYRFQQEVATALRRSQSDRRLRLKQAARLPDRVQVVSLAFRRSPDVVAEVLVRANGKCEACHLGAPFQRRSDGSPYLEVHHRTPLAQGPEDTVDNATALCPNCHRECHFGGAGKD